MPASDKRPQSSRIAAPEAPLSVTCSMSERARRTQTRRAGVCALAGSLAWFTTNLGLAQDAPETEAPAEAAPATTAEAPAAAPAAPPPQTVEVKVSVVPPEAPAPAPEVEAEEAPPPESSGFAPKLNIGVGVRTGLSMAFNPGDDVKFSLQDGLVDQILIRPYMNAKLTDNVSVVANMEVMTTSVHILDAILQLRFADELQLWIGQHIPAQDRNNFCGPFYHNSWNFAANHSYPFDAGARDRGFTFWGFVWGGILKYHLSMVDLQPGRNIGDSRFAGRVTLNFLDPENYYYSQGTYYGAQDTLAIGAAVQYQSKLKKADGAQDLNMDGKIDNEFFAFSFDLLFEKNVTGYGTFTLEGGYWNFNGVGADYAKNQGTSDLGKGYMGVFDNLAAGQSFLAAVSWLSPNKIGIGQLQPNARIQVYNKDAGDAVIYDAGLAYVIDGFNHRWHLNYRHVDWPGDTLDEDSVQFGAQIQL